MANLRSKDWFGKTDKMGFYYRSWFKNQGYPNHLFNDRPVIGICNTWSEMTPCNAHLRDIAEAVKRGVFEAGGFPLAVVTRLLWHGQYKDGLRSH